MIEALQFLLWAAKHVMNTMMILTFEHDFCKKKKKKKKNVCIIK